MPDYSMNLVRLQALDVVEEKDGTIHYVEPGTGAIVERLPDESFPWMARKIQTLKLGALYALSGDEKRHAQANSCSTWLQYRADKTRTTRELNHFNACHLRVCPLCAARRAKLMASRLLRVLDKIEDDAKQGNPAAVLNGFTEVRFIFLTLTIRNCKSGELRHSLDELTRAWNKLMQRRKIKRSVIGWFRAIEITRNDKTGEYHPHLHVILAVLPSYFFRNNPDYIVKDEWKQMWKECLKVDYLPMCSVEGVRGKNKTGKGKDYQAAAVEAAKYTVKDSEYISPKLPDDVAAEVVQTYTYALSGKRLVAFGGIMKDAAKSLAISMDDGDLVGDDAGLGLSAAKYLEDYAWNGVVRDHVLTEVKDNPDYDGVS